jgi:hypothetical protein
MLADMVDGSGKKVLPDLKGRCHPDQRSVYEWPYQESPNAMTWKRWARNIRKLYTKRGKLQTPLGRWLQASPIHQKWRDYVDIDDASAPGLGALTVTQTLTLTVEVIMAYPESNPHQFRKTGAMVVFNRP